MANSMISDSVWHQLGQMESFTFCGIFTTVFLLVSCHMFEQADAPEYSSQRILGLTPCCV
jgi:hypothetical protein